MRLDRATWLEVEAYLRRSGGIILPTGSTEQHGPMGLIGTDAICAEVIAERAAKIADALVAPTIAYAPAPFNTGFPGTISVSQEVFGRLMSEILAGLFEQGFRTIYILNGHGANNAILNDCAAGMSGPKIVIRNWWDLGPVAMMRAELFGSWEGMHATPSEISITQAVDRNIAPGEAAEPPEQLSAAYLRAHAGDKHGSPLEHRVQFPDGRVGSHSALARPEYGHRLLAAAAEAAATEYRQFLE